MATSLTVAYQRHLKNQDFLSDQEQERVLGHFERLHQELLRSGPNHPLNLVQHIRQQLFDLPVQCPRGIYLWGGVGRGKTYLMDLFHECLPFVDKRRVHFHRFMLEIHGRLRNLKREPDTLARVARDMAEDTRVLCFDELFVADIGDAMILTGLFQGLLDHNVALVISSNTPPWDLYRNGLQRHRFLPAIELIEKHTDVIHLGGTMDHRLNSLKQVDVYYAPHNYAAEAHLREIFGRIAREPVVLSTTIDINGRTIPVRAVAHGIVWFNFEVLCCGPYSKVDFAEISRIYHTLVLSDIPILDSNDDDAARRFVELVDELYDRRVNLIVSAAGAPETLYTGTRMQRGFKRVASRLREFQSRNYIAEPHRP